MEHMSDIKLLDYVGGRLGASESEQVRRHIAECSDCAGRHQQTRQMWDTLGAWQVDSSAHQVADRIEVLAGASELHRRPARKALVPSRGSLLAALRIAAAIIIGVGGGHLLGRFSAPASEPTAIISTDKPQYLAALGFEWSSELTWTVLEGDAQNGANQR